MSVQWLLVGDEPEEKAKAQTTNELAALELLRSIPHDKQSAALAMLQGLAGSVTKN